MTELKPVDVWDKHGYLFAKLKLYDISGLHVLKSLVFWCLQRQAQNLSLVTVAALWFILAKFKAFSKFLKYICSVLVSLHIPKIILHLVSAYKSVFTGCLSDTSVPHNG